MDLYDCAFLIGGALGSYYQRGFSMASSGVRTASAILQNTFLVPLQIPAAGWLNVGRGLQQEGRRRPVATALSVSL